MMRGWEPTTAQAVMGGLVVVWGLWVAMFGRSWLRGDLKKRVRR